MQNILITGSGGLAGSHVGRLAVQAERACLGEALRPTPRRLAGPRAASSRAVVA